MENELTYENALENLEKIVVALEKGELPLNDSLELFKKGVELSKFCNETLEKAEQKITILLEDSEGEITEEEFRKDDSN